MSSLAALLALLSRDAEQNPVIIVTHNGAFHADELFACAALLLFFPQARIVRTRDPKAIATADFVVDVGSELDPARLRFDHHQEGGAGQRENNTPYSSFGLVWEHVAKHSTKISPWVWSRVDTTLVQPIDLVDNNLGFSARQGIRPYTPQSMVHGFYPTWNNLSTKQNTDMESLWDDAFEKALQVADMLLCNAIAQAHAEEAAESIVRDAIASATDPRIVVFPHQKIPWTNIIKHKPGVLFVVEPDTNGWVARAVRKTRESGERKKFPKSWWGLEEAALVAASSVESARFCHRSGFIAGADTFEVAMELATKAADASEES